MLTIHNRPDGTIADTDYWQSEYNARGLAYLSGHRLGLRLLLPTAHADEWLPKIQTGKRAVIEPPAQQGYTNHIDIVFDDGTDSPFSLCLDRTKQLDTALRSGSTRLLVYAGSLKNPKQIDRMQNQFLNHPVSAQQAVRTKLEQAAVLGSPDAKIRLQELVAAEILPPSPAARQFHGIREWLHEHLSSWTPTRDEMDADITLLPENAPLLDADEGTERPAWFRIAIFGLVGLLLAVIMVLAIKIVA
mgnify:CR=1 FL=1